MKMCSSNLIFYWIVVKLVFAESQFDEIVDQKQCIENQKCEWDYWQPSKCQNICCQLLNETICKNANCKWFANSSSCFIKKCTEELSNDKCLKIVYNLINQVACTWQNGQCWDSSCIQLQAKETGKCPAAYCIWDLKRKLCYKKNVQTPLLI
ncbi:unnamed protein product [Paramecium sonneborni]|uniref:Uncharacterized protein n=1 Tax=Paramecium sonneborni TaxID=65129 RepID=A0A8S1M1I3_9CILI|nr:unnamed protein product [Paramecium sonneborni]